MTDADQPPSGRGGCAAAAMMLLGVVLLLPGACSVFMILDFAVGKSSGAGVIWQPEWWAIWLSTFGLAALGIFLLRGAGRDDQS